MINDSPYFNFAHYIIQNNVGRPDKIAVVDDTGKKTYGQLSNEICACAQALRQLGLEQEDRIFLLMHDSSEWIVTFLGCLYAGIVPVVANTWLTISDYADMIKDSRIKSVFVSSALLPILEKALDKASLNIKNIVVSQHSEFLKNHQHCFSQLLFNNMSVPVVSAQTFKDEPAFWLYSSGSTGLSKGTIHTHSNLYWSTQLFGKTVLNLDQNDIVLSTAKLFFAYGLGNSMTQPLSVGATTVLMTERPTPPAIFKRLVDQQVTVFFSAPTGYIGMLNNQELPDKDKINLRLCFSGGEALPSGIATKWMDYSKCELIDCIGSTEMLTMFISNRPGNIQLGTTGTPIPGYDIVLKNEQGNIVFDHDVIGDLYVKGPTSALMYWNNRKKTNDTFQGEWVKTGDKYSRNIDGYYIYAGRNDDMLKVSGMYVSPFEIESVLVEHPAILEAAVIGKVNDEGLIKPKAFIVLKNGENLTHNDIKFFVQSRLAPYKYPREVEFVNTLPKTTTGKIQRFRLREQEYKISKQS